MRDRMKNGSSDNEEREEGGDGEECERDGKGNGHLPPRFVGGWCVTGVQGPFDNSVDDVSVDGKDGVEGGGEEEKAVDSESELEGGHGGLGDLLGGFIRVEDFLCVRDKGLFGFPSVFSSRISCPLDEEAPLSSYPFMGYNGLYFVLFFAVH